MRDGGGMYTLGIDLGTTFSAAAVWRGGHAEISSLGSRTAAIPSVVLMREDTSVLTGDAANRRATSEPHRVAREFKRRIGDTTPVLLGGAPYSAEAITARLLKAIVEQVSAAEGGPPEAMVLSHPANWGPYKIDLLTQAVRIADVEVPVSYVTEPEAAAVFYATQQRVPVGAVVAVYDLGGGTFDAAVLRRTADGFAVLGQPEGIERLGGIDVDAAVFDHVSRALGGKLDELDEDDPAAATAVARLRTECVDAKEALSSDTDVSVPVILPNVTTDVRLTRSELEAMVRPALQDTIDALRRALRSAEVAPEDLESVLLVGGASRMPLVGQLVGAEIGRPVAVDAHPKHAVALGAAWLAAEAAGAVAPASAPEEHEEQTAVLAATPGELTSASGPGGVATVPAPRSGPVPAAAVGATALAAGMAGAAAPAGAAALMTPGAGIPQTGGFPAQGAPVPPPRQENAATQLLGPGGGPHTPAGGTAFGAPPSAPPGRSRPAFAVAEAPSKKPRTRLLLLSAAAVLAIGGIAVGTSGLLSKSTAATTTPTVAPVVATSSVAPITTTTVTATPTPEPAPAPVQDNVPARRPATHRYTPPVQRPAPLPPPAPVTTRTVTSVTTVTKSTPPPPPPTLDPTPVKKPPPPPTIVEDPPVGGTPAP